MFKMLEFFTKSVLYNSYTNFKECYQNVVSFIITNWLKNQEAKIFYDTPSQRLSRCADADQRWRLQIKPLRSDYKNTVKFSNLTLYLKFKNVESLAEKKVDTNNKDTITPNSRQIITNLVLVH